jgi:hypothetical protein
MNRIVVEPHVNNDGLHELLLTLGSEEAGREVQVTIEPVDPKNEMTRDESRAGILATAGGWQGEFDQASEGVVEERDPLS